ncbi:MAG: hypothetical protein ACOY5C_07065 [Pseudomonadota bacterium]|uniref:hypothetical protein n=1 Tax=Thermithiobacillus tepidarius TaxID=929 RepID=UPI0012DCF7BE|nr:hypothetical protein [Thermithiobacillus tepidarius]
MNQVMQEKSGSSWEQRYVRWLRFGNWLLIPIYVLLIFVPLYYEATAMIPSKDGLQLSRGELIYKWTGRRGALIGLRFENETIHYFTCRSGLLGKSHDCFLSVQELKRLTGKPAAVWWFEQPVYPFATQHRLARLIVDGREKVSLEVTIKRVRRANEDAPWLAAGLLVFFVATAIYFERLARRIERGQADS